MKHRNQLSEARQTAIPQTALACVISIDHEGRIIEFNPAAERTFGYRREDVLGREMADVIIPPSRRERYRRGLEHYLATEEGPHLDWRIELPAVRADGTKFPIEITVTRVPTEEPPIFTAYLRDITERRRTEEALRRSEERYLAIFETVGVSIWDEDFSEVKTALDALASKGVTDVCCYLREHPAFVERMLDLVRIRNVNETTLKLFGADSKKDLLGSLRRIFLPDTRSVFRKELVTVACGQTFMAAEAPVQTLQGERLEVVFTFAAADPAYRHVLVSLLDITQRKRAEEALHARLRRLALLHELSAEMVQARHLDEVYRCAIDTVMEALGADRAALLLFDEAAVMRFKAWQGLSDAYRAATTGHSPWTPETSTPRPLAVSDVQHAPEMEALRETILDEGIHALAFIPLVYEGRLIGKFMVYYDQPHDFDEEALQLAETIANQVAVALERQRGVDALLEREQQLRALNETLEERIEERTQQVHDLARRLTMAERQERRRVAQILHDDLQQILYGIRIKVGIIGQDLQPDEHPKRRQALEEASAWIDQAITAARPLSVDLSPPLLQKEGLTNAFEWLQTQMQELHGLEVVVEAEHAWDIRDEDLRVLLFQIVRELLFNVKKHANVKQATVKLTEEMEHLVIHVIDEGDGFDVDEVAATEAHEGGFGLFSVRERLALLGGRLEVRSRPGEGTHIEVHAPVQSGPRREAGRRASAALPGRGAL